MKRFGHLIYQWFMGPVDARPLVAVRVGVGLTLALAYLQMLFAADFLFGSSGLVVPGSLFRHLASDVAAYFFSSIVVISGLAFAFGYAPIVSGVTALVCHFLIYQSAPFPFWSWADLIQPFLVYLLFFEWVRQRDTPISAAWPLRLVQIHVCTIYVVASVSRLDNLVWQNGDALFYALWNEKFGRFEVDWWTLKEWLQPLGKLSLWMEFAAPILLWLPILGPIYALLMMGFHLSLELMTTVGYWQALMISVLFAFTSPSINEETKWRRSLFR